MSSRELFACLLPLLFVLPALAADKPPSSAVTPEELQRRLISGSFSGHQMSLRCERERFSDVIKQLEAAGELELTVDSSVTDRVRVFVDDIPWDQALDLVLDKGDLELVVEHGRAVIRRKPLLHQHQPAKENTRFIGEPVSFVYQGVDIKNVIVDLVSNHGKDYGEPKIVIYPGIRGKVTCDLGEVPWDEGLDQILGELGLELSINGSLLRVRRTERFSCLNALSAEELMANLRNRVFTGQVIKLFITDVEIRELLQYLAEAGCLDISIDERVTGRVSVEWFRGSWDQLLDTVLYTFHLELVAEHDILHIRPAREPVASLLKAGEDQAELAFGGKPVDLHFRDEDLGDVIRWFADRHPLNYVLNADWLQGDKVTFEQTGAAWREALATLLRRQGFEVVIIKVDPPVGDYLMIRKVNRTSGEG